MKYKYEIIMDKVEEKAQSGLIRPGGRLPSIKSMALELGCNKSTVIRAYEELEKKHKIYAVPKSGYYMVENKEKRYPESDVIDFVTVNPDSELLPYKEFNHCINRAVELYREDLFLYGETQGFEPLRKRLVPYFQEFQIFTTPEQICITAGSQQAISILLQMPFPNGRSNILVEEPSYHLVHKFLRNRGLKVYGVRRDFQGIDLKELERRFCEDEIKVFYTMSRMHNPLGTSFSEDEKKKIVLLAQKYDVYIIEDDYMGDMETRKNSFPLYYYDISSHVIYVQGFSKTFMPGIRVGGAILNSDLRETFLKFKGAQDLNTSVLEQGALEIFMHSGMFIKHRQKARAAYRQKMKCAREVLEGEELPGVKLLVPETGFFIWLVLDEDIDTVRLVRKLKEKGVLVRTGEDFFYAKEKQYQGIRLSIARLGRTEIEKGLKILCRELQGTTAKACQNST